MKLPLGMLVLLITGCAANDAAHTAPAASPQARDFEQRVSAYVQLKEQAGAGLLPLETTKSPGEIDAVQSALAARIRERRAGAKQGDIFTPEIRTHFRQLIAGPLTGARADAIRDLMKEDAPAPGAIDLEVNGIYPTSQPYATTPPSMLALLPALPTGLEYRVVGRDLILLDQTANLIVDFMRNAIPPDRR